MQAHKWYAAIPARHAVRAYTGEPIDEEVMNRLRQTASAFSGPAARAVISTESIDRVFRGIIGSYGKIMDAPAFIALIGNTSEPNHVEMCGYIGEAMALEAVSAGLATCWVGGFFRPENVAQVIDLLPDDRVLALISAGYEGEVHSFSDKVLRKVARSHSRKDLPELAGGLPRDEWPSWIETALKAARLAPSAMNRQPWRFDVGADSITISVDNLNDTYRIPKRLDCGIAMLHLEVGAGEAGVDGEWEFLDPPAVARFLRSG